MCELFSFSTPRDGQVDVWRSPVDQMLRLSNAVPPQLLSSRHISSSTVL